MTVGADAGEGVNRAGIRRAAAAAGALALLLALFFLPDHASRLVPAAFLRLPVEAAGLLLLLAATPARLAGAVAALAGAAAGLSAVLRVGDMAAYAAFARPFNPVLDGHLIGAAMNLLTGAIGLAGAVAAAVAALVATLVVLALAVAATRMVARRVVRARGRAAAAGLALALAWAALAASGAEAGRRLPYASADALRSLSVHATGAWASLDDLRRFRGIAAEDPRAAIAADRLLAGLRGRDVIVAFVESYGRTVLDDPRYAPAVTSVLERGDDTLAALGIGVRSGFLASPTVGGMSWLAHATALSGLAVDNQRRHDSLMTSERMTLNRAFGKAGWRTVAIMPAITMAWPEGAFYGYDEVYDADGLGYRGKPFNWVTMPDQFTWHALDRLELTAADRPPVMAEMALISSHAPWTPVPQLIPWEYIGNGSVFNDMATSGDPPEVVWKDPDRVRLQYRRSIEYALETMVSYAARADMRRTVIVVLGDHQPAPLVTGEDAGRDVPVHILSADPAILDAIAAWGFTPSLIPAADAPVWPMQDVRDRLIDAFTPGGAG